MPTPGAKTDIDPPQDTAQMRRKRRERFLMVLIALTLIFTTALSVYLSGSSTFISMAGDIVVFGLFSANVILILILLFLVLRNVVKLIFERRKGKFGAKLRSKFVIAFVGFSVIPAVLLFAAAISYIAKSTDLWLNNQIELSLGMTRDVVAEFRRMKIDDHIRAARRIGRDLENEGLLSPGLTHSLEDALQIKRREYDLDVLAFFRDPTGPAAGSFSAKFGPSPRIVGPNNKEALNLALGGEERSEVVKIEAGELLHSFVPVYSSYDPKDVAGAVLVGYVLPETLGIRMHAINQTFEQYHKLRTRKIPIQWSYYILLTIVFLIVIFLSTWFGFYMAKQIITPLQTLAEKTQLVASGDLDFELQTEPRDELGVLMESFNRMTRQLKKSQQALDASHNELTEATLESERRRRYMEIVLKDIAGGVIALDAKNTVTTMNRSAEEMLDIEAESIVHRNIEEAFPEEFQPIAAVIRDLMQSQRETLQNEIRLNIGGSARRLRIHANILRDERGDYMGLVVVLDDITELERIQQTTAWKEVARRIAHEIKNPLTPIKLSAQRIRKRYLGAGIENGAILDECTTAIIDQTDHLQELVNEFQNFAKMPEADLKLQDLNSIIHEVTGIYRGSRPDLDITFEEGSGLPHIAVDGDQIRRAVINLIDNALAVIPEKGGCIRIRSMYNRKLRVVRLEIADNGPGIPYDDKGMIFEPYFSRKKTGTGLGLTIVKSIIVDHRGYIRVTDNEPRGARFVIELPL